MGQSKIRMLPEHPVKQNKKAMPGYKQAGAENQVVYHFGNQSYTIYVPLILSNPPGMIWELIRVVSLDAKCRFATSPPRSRCKWNKYS
jgi:hypothetical protein